MTVREPRDPVVRAEWARLRRRAAATYHPDRGGDAEAYLSALAAVDQAFGIHGGADGPGRASASVQQVEVRRTWRGSRMRVARHGRRALRTLRNRLPDSFPGAEHTTEI